MDRLRKGIFGLFLLKILLIIGVSGVAKGQKTVDLTELPLEDLMNIEVTLAMRKETKLQQTAAAIYVITNDEIRRSGFTTIPDVLRMVPGMQVARIDANKWAVSARGFNSLFSNKLLVLIDGRSVYSPIFSGVLWEAQDVLFEDIDRIEIIRGPGATLWGANAVNGIINIITKNTRDSQGTFLHIGMGSEEKNHGCLRYGGKMGNATYYRVYSKFFNRDNDVYQTGNAADDKWGVFRNGFRVDMEMAEQNTICLQGDIYSGKVQQSIRLSDSDGRLVYETPIRGGSALCQWIRTFSNTSGLNLHLSYDNTQRDDDVLVGGNIHVIDMDLQHFFKLNSRQEIIWGFGYRFIHDKMQNSSVAYFDPESRNYQLVSAFVQDEMALIKKRLNLIIGTKLEHNDFTGFEIQPNIRTIWMPQKDRCIWSAISRAVRTPSRADHDLYSFAAKGNRDFLSEELTAVEVGTHYRLIDPVYNTLSIFYNHYDKLLTLEQTYMANKKRGNTYGIELTSDIQYFRWWRLRAVYSYLRIRLRLDKDSQDSAGKDVEGESPRHQFSLNSMMNLRNNLELDFGIRYVSRLSGQDLNVKSYTDMDAHLAWKPCPKLELSLTGHNLLYKQHPEFSAGWLVFNTTEIQRSIFVSTTFRF